MEGLTEGRIVHFVMPTGKHRPAIITQVWNKSTGSVNLSVFTDWANDGVGPLLCETSRLPSDKLEPGTWHWIEKA